MDFSLLQCNKTMQDYFNLEMISGSGVNNSVNGDNNSNNINNNSNFNNTGDTNNNNNSNFNNTGYTNNNNNSNFNNTGDTNNNNNSNFSNTGDTNNNIPIIIGLSIVGVLFIIAIGIAIWKKNKIAECFKYLNKKTEIKNETNDNVNNDQEV